MVLDIEGSDSIERGDQRHVSCEICEISDCYAVGHSLSQYIPPSAFLLTSQSIHYCAHI